MNSEENDLAQRVDALLPQTQCTQCGYNGCWPYAQAIAAEQAPINQCPPGGERVIAALASLLGRQVIALNPTHGIEKPLEVAVIDEALCIGCTLCIQACPVDAIMGAARHMHTVLPKDCTGCALCVAPCPMDCIQMQPVSPTRLWNSADAQRARTRMHTRQARLAREAGEQEERLRAKALAKLDELEQRDDLSRSQIEQKKAVVNAALERARARRLAARQDKP